MVAFVGTEPVIEVELVQPAMWGGRCHNAGDKISVTVEMANRLARNGKIVLQDDLQTAAMPDGARRAVINPVRRPGALTVDAAGAYDSDPIATNAHDGYAGPHPDEVALPAAMIDPKVTARLSVPPGPVLTTDLAAPKPAKAEPKVKDKDVN